MYLVFDIGGTKTRIATSDDGQNLNEPIIFETPKSYQEFLELFKENLSKLTTSNINRSAGGIAGPLVKDRSTITGPDSLTLKDFRNQPIQNDLEKLTGGPVSLLNDTAVVGLGEALAGSGKGFEIVGYLTVSTGIGGCRIVDGKVDRYSQGFEPAYQIAKLNEETLEFNIIDDLTSGSALERKYQQKAEDIKDSKIWESVEKYIAVLINNTILYWSPDVIVLGGSIMKTASLENVEKYLTKIFRAYPEYPPIKLAALGDLGGLYGALEYIKQN